MTDCYAIDFCTAYLLYTQVLGVKISHSSNSIFSSEVYGIREEMRVRQVSYLNKATIFLSNSRYSQGITAGQTFERFFTYAGLSHQSNLLSFV